MSDEPLPNVIRNLSGPIDRDAKQSKRESAAFTAVYSDRTGIEALYDGVAMLLADDDLSPTTPLGGDRNKDRTWWEDALGITVSPEQRARNRAAIEALQSVYSPTEREVSPADYLASIISILKPNPPCKP